MSVVRSSFKEDANAFTSTKCRRLEQHKHAQLQQECQAIASSNKRQSTSVSG